MKAGSAMGQESALVYKIFRETEYQSFVDSGVFQGSADDVRDGFIHLSFASQVRKTIEKHFDGESQLVIGEFESQALGEQLRFEVSRNEQLFPHLYGTLEREHLRRCVALSELG